jgi:hypothetical protein
MKTVFALALVAVIGVLFPAQSWAGGAGVILADDELATVWAGQLNGENGIIPSGISVSQDVSGQNSASGQNITTAMLSFVAAQNNVATASSNSGGGAVSITQSNNAAFLSPIPF